MMDPSTKFSRKLICLALACAGAGAAYAGPAGPVVSAGRASYDPATLTVISTTAHTHIGWQSFNVSTGEVVNFVQPNAQSSVLNYLFNPQSLNILGSLRSNGSVLFMTNGRVSGSGVNLDLAGMISASLRLPQMALAQSGGTPLAPPLTTFAEGSIYVISQDEQAVTTANGDLVLNPGKTIELARASMPSLRVGLTAPNAEAINLSRLVGNKRETGIFAGLFRVPAAARQAAQPDAEATLTAAASAHTPDTPDIERLHRYAPLFAQLRRETLPHEGGMMQVAAAQSGRMMLAAVKSRSSLLPRDIEIGAPRPQELALRPGSLPFSAEAERPPAKLERQAASIAAQSESQGDSAPLLAYVSVEPPAEMVATRKLQPVVLAAGSAVQTDSAPVLAYAAVEPPAEMVAPRKLQPVVLAAGSAAQTDSAPVLAYAAIEPPAEMVATRKLTLITVVAASEPQPDSAAVLALAPAEPPAQSMRVQRAQRELDAAQVRPEARPAPTVIVVAQAQTSASPVLQEKAGAKQLRIERRAPRYFTDYRGAMFFM
jgi:filamentous hemagglutinin family protein